MHASYRPTMRRVAGLLIALGVVQGALAVLPAPREFQDIAHYLPLHAILETIAILIAMMVFTVGWTSRMGTAASGNVVLLSCLFFAIGCLDVSHTLSYAGMPDFFSPNGPDKPVWFWMGARLMAAASLFIVAVRPWNREIRKTRRFLLFGAVLVGVLAFSGFVIFHQADLPALYRPGQGLTSLKKNLEFLCIAINLATLLVLWAKMREAQGFNAPLLFAAAGVMAMSEFYFTLYTTMAGVFNILGHVYKVISYLFIYRAVVMESIERPYLQLTQVRRDLDLASRASDQARRHLQAVLDAIPSLVAYWDVDLKNRFANKAYVEYFGVSPEAIRDRHLSFLLGDALYRKNLPFLEAALRGEEQDFERAIPSPDGKTTKYTRAKYLPDLIDGRVQGIFVFVYDITDLKVTLEKLSQVNMQLKQRTLEAEQASQSKGQFLANMSHEIRTPMNAILGLLSLLQKNDLTPQQRDYVSKADGAAKSLLGLLNDILDFSKVEAGKLTLESEPFSIEQLLRDLSVVYSANVGAKDLEVLFDIDPTLPGFVRGDAMRLQQVLINLGGNAIKFTSQGQVVLSLKKRAETSRSVTLEFAVQDTGIGIAPEHQDYIFSGFSQAEGSTTRRFGGTGLGLAISQRLVRTMGGDIALASEPGAGSRFSFCLELPTEPQGAHTGPRQAARQSALIVDSNPVAAQLMARMLRSLGWDVDLAASGPQALQRAAERLPVGTGGFPYGVAYVDSRLPAVDGGTVSARLRELARGQGLPEPVIILTSTGGREVLRQAARSSAEPVAGVLTKPVTASMMLEAFLDAQPGGARSRAAQAVPATPGPLLGLRILVVEDNLLNQQVAEELLGAEGAVVSLAANGQLGVDAVRAAKPQFDVVLMDLQMPVLDGFGATRALRGDARFSQLPIIAMTANAMHTDREACLAAGMNEHIGKPFDMKEVVRQLLKATGRRAAPAREGDAPSALPTAYAAAASQQHAEAGVEALDGLALKPAIARLMDSTALYVKVARAFGDSVPSVTEAIGAACAKGDRQQAGRLLHALKGNAGTLGLVALARESERLEAACGSDEGFKAVAAGLEGLSLALRQAQALLERAILTLQSPVESG